MLRTRNNLHTLITAATSLATPLTSKVAPVEDARISVTEVPVRALTWSTAEVRTLLTSSRDGVTASTVASAVVRAPECGVSHRYQTDTRMSGLSPSPVTAESIEETTLLRTVSKVVTSRFKVTSTSTSRPMSAPSRRLSGVGAAEQKRPKARKVNAERAKERMASDKECRERV